MLDIPQWECTDRSPFPLGQPIFKGGGEGFVQFLAPCHAKQRYLPLHPTIINFLLQIMLLLIIILRYLICFRPLRCTHNLNFLSLFFFQYILIHENTDYQSRLQQKSSLKQILEEHTKVARYRFKGLSISYSKPSLHIVAIEHVIKPAH